MAVVHLTASVGIENYAETFESRNVNQPCGTTLPPLSHFAFPGLTWRILFYPRGTSLAKPNFASVYLEALFGSEKESVASVWASWTLTIVAGGTSAQLLKAVVYIHEYLKDGCTRGGSCDAFPHDALETALQKDGHLEMKVDLRVYKVVDLLKCRETVRALLSANQYADFTIDVEGQTIKAHKAILAKRCPGFLEAALVGTTADAYSAFLSCVYYDRFDLLSNWTLALDLLRLSGEIGSPGLKRFCDDALADLIPTLSFPIILEILSTAIRCDAPATKSACIHALTQKKDVLTSEDWSKFKAATEGTNVPYAICDALLHKFVSCDSVAKTAVYHAVEIKLTHTWSIASADLLKAVVPRPASVTSPVLLEHKAFPGLKWQLEFYPHGNSQDPSYTQGFASLYLIADFGECDGNLKAVYANWKATITMKDGTQVSTPASQDYTLYTGVKEMMFGYAKAFPVEQYNKALTSKTANPTDLSLDIRLDLTIANIPAVLQCHRVIASVLSDKTYADVEFDVSGVIFNAHKCILAVRSSKFSAMFETARQQATSGKVEVKDTTPDAFKAFLAAVYYENWDFLSDLEATVNVFKLAVRYDVADLKRYCDETLAHGTETRNVLTVLPYAAMYNAEATKSACVEILCTCEALMTSDEWIEFKGKNKEIAYDIAEAVIQHHRRSLKRKREDD